MDKTRKFTTTDEYIAMFPKDIQDKLNKVRQVIKEAAPEAKEIISYQMPAFKMHGNLVYFAALKDHIGLYPTSSGVAAFQNELKDYATSKGTIKFPLNEPIPFNLITKIVKFRVKEDQQNAKNKKNRY